MCTAAQQLAGIQRGLGRLAAQTEGDGAEDRRLAGAVVAEEDVPAGLEIGEHETLERADVRQSDAAQFGVGELRSAHDLRARADFCFELRQEVDHRGVFRRDAVADQLHAVLFAEAVLLHFPERGEGRMA